jgi:hypothetical protein
MISNSEVKVVQGYLEMLATLTRERLKIERRLESVEASLRSILALHDDEEVMPFLEQLDNIIQPEGFTEAVRKVLRSSNEPLTPAEVKDRLPGVGFFLAGYSNPSASIHTILKRLAKTESVEVTPKDGKMGYRWVGLVRPVTLADHVMRAALQRETKTGTRGKLVDQVKEFKPTYNHPDPLGKRGKK